MKPPDLKSLEPPSVTRLTRIGHGPDQHGKMQVVLLTKNPRLTIGMIAAAGHVRMYRRDPKATGVRSGAELA